MAKKNKLNEQIIYYQNTVNRIIGNFSIIQLMKFIDDRLQIKIDDIAYDIERELHYANNETDSYASQKKDAKNRAKLMKNELKVLEKNKKQMQDAFSNIKTLIEGL